MEVPSSLFKYTTASTAKIILATGCIRWSSPEIFNDPADFRRLPVFAPTLKESMAIAPRLVIDAAAGDATIDVAKLCEPTKYLYDLVHYAIGRGMRKEDFLETILDEDRPLDDIYHEHLRAFFGDNFTKQARVLCLTANPVNPAMWANYAENHAGCLLEFSHIPELSTPLQEARPVSYSIGPPHMGSGVDMILYNSAELRGKTIDAVCFAKRKEWEYEQEWRVVTWRSNEPDQLYGDYPFFPRELVAITFGLKMAEESVADLTALVRAGYPHASINRIVSSFGELSRVGV